MNFPKRKMVRWSIIFIIGGIFGGAATLYFSLKVYSHFLIEINESSARHAIMSPYGILRHLRKNDTKNAIELLELEMDSGLISLAHNKINNDTDRLILERIREYRTKYPRENKNPDIDKITNDLLFPLKNVKTIYWDNNKQNIKATRKYIRKGNKLLPHGKWQKWYRNGNLASERFFREGKLILPVKIWHSNGKLKSLIPYNSNGQINGVAKWWNKKGELVQSSKHKNSTGDMYSFYPNYAISSRMHFVNGKIKTTTYYSQDGKEITINEYLKILNKVGYDTFP